MKNGVVFGLLVAVLLCSTGVFAASSHIATRVDLGQEVIYRLLDVSTEEVVERSPGEVKNVPMAGMSSLDFSSEENKVKLLVLVHTGGTIAYQDVLGPLTMGEDYGFDLRDGKTVQMTVEELMNGGKGSVAPSSPSESEVPSLVNETPATSNESSKIPAETPSVQGAGTETPSSGALTGKVVVDVGDSVRILYIVGWSAVAIVGVFSMGIFFSHKRKKNKVGAVGASAVLPTPSGGKMVEDDELAKIEAEVKRKGEEIRVMREKIKKRQEIAAAQQELKQKEKEVNQLQGQMIAADPKLADAERRLKEREKELSKLQERLDSTPVSNP